jgi:hypothetical protein
VVNVTDHDFRTKSVYVLLIPFRAVTRVAHFILSCGIIIPFLHTHVFSRPIHMTQNRMWIIPQNKLRLDAKKKYKTFKIRILPKTNYRLLHHEKFYTSEWDCRRGGNNKWNSDDDTEGAWGENKIYFAYSKICELALFFKLAPANPLVRYADHISALQHGRVYLSRGGCRGQHHQVALLSQTPAGSATIVIHFISPLWRLKQICNT